jgi:hypothetical protein
MHNCPICRGGAITHNQYDRSAHCHWRDHPTAAATKAAPPSRNRIAKQPEARLLQHKDAPDPPDSCGFLGSLFMIPITDCRPDVPLRPIQSHWQLTIGNWQLATGNTSLPCASSSPRSTVISTPPAALRCRRANCSSCWVRAGRIAGRSRPGCSTMNARPRSMRCSRDLTCPRKGSGPI